jgi:quinol monooxygenase YgiN
MTKSRTEPNTYKAIEIFKDQEAQTYYTEHIQSAGPKFNAMLAGTLEVEHLDGID